jgi:hypothetical protein
VNQQLKTHKEDPGMGARFKLNILYIKIALIVAGLLGLPAGSWLVFILVLMVAVTDKHFSGHCLLRRSPAARGGVSKIIVSIHRQSRHPDLFSIDLSGVLHEIPGRRGPPWQPGPTARRELPRGSEMHHPA